jgi:hypothetical protein
VGWWKDQLNYKCEDYSLYTCIWYSIVDNKRQAWPSWKDSVYLKEGTLWSWIKLHNKTPWSIKKKHPTLKHNLMKNEFNIKSIYFLCVFIFKVSYWLAIKYMCWWRSKTGWVSNFGTTFKKIKEMIWYLL